MDIKTLYNRVIGGHLIRRDEALFLYNQDLENLTRYANMIRDHFCGNQFDMCTIINGKSGLCSESLATTIQVLRYMNSYLKKRYWRMSKRMPTKG